MQTKRAMSIIGIILGSSLVALAGEVTNCQTRVQREGPKDLTYWSWRTIDVGSAGIAATAGNRKRNCAGQTRFYPQRRLRLATPS